MIQLDQLVKAARSVLAIAGVFLTSSAFAGHYVASVTTKPTVVVTKLYPPGGGGGGNFTAGAGTITGTYGGSNVRLELSGTMTTTFTWTPDSATDDEPAPLSAVVKIGSRVKSQAQWYGGVGTASASCGLPAQFVAITNVSGPIIYGTVPIGWGQTYTANGSSAEVKGGATFTINTAVSGSAVAGNGPASIEVIYSAAAYPVRLAVSNAVVDEGSYYTEPGRLLTAGLSCAATDVQFTGHSYETGSDGYFHYITTAPSHTTPPEILQGQVKFRLIKGGLRMPKGVAQATFAGTDIGTVTAERPLTLELPKQLNVQVYTSANGYYTHGTWVNTLSSSDDSLRIPPINMSDGAVGAYWVWSGKTAEHFPMATLSTCQLIMCDNYAGTSHVSTGGEYWLDAEYPYLSHSFGVPGFFTNTSGLEFSCVDQDTPKVQSITSSMSISDHFDTYLMYRGMSGNTTDDDAPLFRFFWDWMADSIGMVGSGLVPGPVKGMSNPWSKHPTWPNVLSTSN